MIILLTVASYFTMEMDYVFIVSGPVCTYEFSRRLRLFYNQMAIERKWKICRKPIARAQKCENRPKSSGYCILRSLSTLHEIMTIGHLENIKFNLKHYFQTDVRKIELSYYQNCVHCYFHILHITQTL